MRIDGDVDKLLQELRSDDPAERIYVLTALAAIPDRAMDDELVRGLFDPDRDCRATAARMLGDREAKSAVPPLIHALLDSSSDIAQEAAEALGKIRDPRAVEPLTRVLAEYSAPARAAAARALGSLGDPRAVRPLAQSLSDPAETVRAEAAEALGELEAEEAIPDLVHAVGDASDRVRQAALSALRRLGPQAVEALVAELRTDDSVRRWRGAWALGECAAPAAVNPLIRALRDESETVRAQAALSLGAIGARNPMDALRAAARDPSAAVREAAALSLARLGELPARSEAGGQQAVRVGPDRKGTEEWAALAAPQRTRRRLPGCRVSWDLTLLLVAVAVLILVVLLLANEVIRAHRSGPPDAGVPSAHSGIVTPVPAASAWKQGGAAQSIAPPRLSEEPVELPSETATGAPPGDAGRERAECEITSSVWFADGDTLVVRGQVVNTGQAPASNVTVRVSAKDNYGRTIGRKDGPVTPNRIRPGHSGDFEVSIAIPALPALTAKPIVEAIVRWN